MAKSRKIAEVIIPIHLLKAFDYLLPEGMKVLPGCRVAVNFRGTNVVGIVKSLLDTSAVPAHRLKSLQKVIDRQPLIDKDIFCLARFIAEEYHVGEGEALKLFLPGFLGKKPITLPDGALPKSGKKPVSPEWFEEPKQGEERFPLYKERISEVINAGYSVLLCVPTIEDISRVAAHFNQMPFCTYSAQQPAGQARESWVKFKTGEIPFCIGTRGAFFILPVRLGLVILDDCLNDAYDHPEKPFYRLSELVLYLNRIRSLRVILNSIRPSLALHTLLKRKRISVVDLSRPNAPAVRIVAAQRAFLKTGQIISPFVSEIITRSLNAKEQLLIFYNKKGFASLLKCASCKQTILCPRCNTPLKYYFSRSTLECPACAKTLPYTLRCPLCGKGYLSTRGLGIERLQSLLQRFFPDAAVCEWDNPANQKIAPAQIILATSRIFSNLPADFSVPRTIVLGIDSLFYRPEHDASLRVFFLLQKLKEITGKELIVISSLSEHHAIRSVEHEADWFYQKEQAARKAYCLPPYFKIVKLIFRGLSEKTVHRKAEQAGQLCAAVSSQAIGPVEVLGPLKEIPYKLRDRYYYSIILTARNKKALRQVISAALGKIHLGNIRLAVIPRYE